MADIYGALGVNQTDSQYAFISTFGQQAIYDAVNYVLQVHTEDLNASLACFVERETSAHQIRYMLPGGGRMQRVGPDSVPSPTKASGSWTCGFPLEEFAANLSWSRVSYAYSTMEDLDRHVKGIQQQNIYTVRHELLEKLYNNASTTFTDPQWGSLTVKCLANNDSDTYPPVLGAETDATANNYLASGYAASAISNTNNPFPTIVHTLESHFGTPTGGSPIAVFINNDQTAATEALADFVPFTDRYIRPGDDADIVAGMPPELQMGSWRVLGRINGATVCEWAFVPTGYLLGVHLGAPKPLLKRIDPPDRGLGNGIQMVSRSDRYPFTESVYSHRFGFGAGNRINGVVMQLTTGSYSVPSGF